MSQDFSLSSKTKNGFLVITTNGYINLDGGEKIAEEAYKHIDDGVTKIVIDAGNSRVVNSIGISILIEVIEKLEGVNGKMYFANLSPTVEKTFKIMGLFKYAEKVDSIDALVA